MSLFKVIAPALNHPAHSDSESFGSAAWLWMQSSQHCNLPLLALDAMLLPAIRQQQYVLVLEESETGSRPIGYLGWANLSAEAESRYLHGLTGALTAQDWNSGDRMWFTDFFAPLGRAREVHARMKPLFARISARYMYHHSNERGVRVQTFTGTRVDPAYARQWWAERPMLAAKSPAAARVCLPGPHDGQAVTAA